MLVLATKHTNPHSVPAIGSFATSFILTAERAFVEEFKGTIDLRPVGATERILIGLFEAKTLDYSKLSGYFSIGVELARSLEADVDAVALRHLAQLFSNTLELLQKDGQNLGLRYLLFVDRGAFRAMLTKKDLWWILSASEDGQRSRRLPLEKAPFARRRRRRMMGAKKPGGSFEETEESRPNTYGQLNMRSTEFGTSLVSSNDLGGVTSYYLDVLQGTRLAAVSNFQFEKDSRVFRPPPVVENRLHSLETTWSECSVRSQMEPGRKQLRRPSAISAEAVVCFGQHARWGTRGKMERWAAAGKNAKPTIMA